MRTTAVAALTYQLSSMADSNMAVVVHEGSPGADPAAVAARLGARVDSAGAVKTGEPGPPRPGQCTMTPGVVLVQYHRLEVKGDTARVSTYLEKRASPTMRRRHTIDAAGPVLELTREPDGSWAVGRVLVRGVS